MNMNAPSTLVAVLPWSSALSRDAARIVGDLATRGAEAVELRLDLADQAPDPYEVVSAIRKVAELDSDRRVPLIACARLVRDGGKWRGDERSRRVLLQAAADVGVAFLDVELQSEWTPQQTAQSSTTLIRSYHDIEQTSRASIERIMATAEPGPRDIVKIATRARTLADNLVMRDLLRYAQRGRLAAFCIGPRGLPSRLLGRWWGSAVVYCAAKSGELPMPSLDDCIRIYHLRRYNGFRHEEDPPELFGVAGAAASRSLSPYLHNNLFSASARHAIFLPLETDSFEDARNFAEEAGIKGMAVTTPFKAAAAATCADAVSQAVKRCDAANTLVRSKSGHWHGENTDVAGFAREFADVIAQEHWHSRQVLVLGSGGAARSLLWALTGKVAGLYLWARNPEKGQALAHSFGATWLADPGVAPLPLHVVVNATSAGMAGGPDPESPACDLTRLNLSADAVAIDLVYHPSVSPFLQAASRCGLRTRNGIGMLLYQGREQHMWFSDTPALDEAMPLLRHRMRSMAEHNSGSGSFGRCPGVLPMTRVALLGYRGAGKSSVGRLLALRMGALFLDLDDMVEAAAHQRAHAIFFAGGEAAYRTLERQELTRARNLARFMVLATGGGTVESEECRLLLRERFTLIFIDTPEDVLIERLKADQSRPNLGQGSVEQQLDERMRKRLPHYLALADYRVEAGRRTADDVADEIYHWLRGEGA